MSKPTDLELAYFAGFFDGEGSMSINNRIGGSPRGVSPNHSLQVSIGNTDPAVLRTIHSYFGGSLTLRKTAKPNHRNVTQWIIPTVGALGFLVAIRPYLVMKAEAADVAIEYQKTKSMRGPRRVTEEDIKWREEQRLKIQQINAKQRI